MNTYEQFKNSFLVELENSIPELKIEHIKRISQVLDRAAYPYDVKEKETYLVPFDNPIPNLIKTYIVVKKTEGLSDGTLSNYARTLKQFFMWARKPPEEITANDIRMFLYDYSQKKGVSGRTLDKYREFICWFFHWAHTEEYISKDPSRAVKEIKHEVKQRVALTQVELEYLRLACKTAREKAMIEFFYSTGCRVSELTIVKKSDLNLDAGTVHLFGKGRKHRTSFINAKCEVALKEYLNSRNDDCEYLFVTTRRPHRQMTKATVEKIIGEIAERTKISKKVTPHILRHTSATQAVNNGMPIENISKFLGHASVATTMIYAQVSEENVQAQHTKHLI